MALGVIDCTADSMVLQTDFGQQFAFKAKRRIVSTNRQTEISSDRTAGWRQADSGGIAAQ
jgi:hypothetical protein